MEIKVYIKELLFTNQGVIIPRLGGFVSEYEPAVFDVNENKFLPPSKKITFNPKYSYKDDLLIEFISKKENIDKEKSKIFIDDFAKDVKQKLEKGEKVNFPEIGTLSQTRKGEIVFIQDKESNLLTESFGLQSIKTKPIKNQQTTSKTLNPVKKKYISKPIIFGALAIVFLSLIALSWFLTEAYTDFNLLSSNKKTIIKPSKNIVINTLEKNLDSIANADSIKGVINQSIDANTNKKDALFYTEPKKTCPTDEKNVKLKYSKFHIIAGSFKKMKNAEEFASKLKNKAYDPVIIQSDKNLIRISIYSFTDETLALKKLYKLREKSDIKSVWILKTL